MLGVSDHDGETEAPTPRRMLIFTKDATPEEIAAALNKLWHEVNDAPDAADERDDP